MNDISRSKNKGLSEDRKEILRILLAVVVMAIIFWVMLLILSVP